MLLRGANAVGYTSYPDNVIVEFVREAHAQGIDIFRIFDSLNSIKNMRVAIDARSEEHTSELQSRLHLVCRLLLEKKNKPVTRSRTDLPPPLPVPRSAAR